MGDPQFWVSNVSSVSRSWVTQQPYSEHHFYPPYLQFAGSRCGNCIVRSQECGDSFLNGRPGQCTGHLAGHWLMFKSQCLPLVMYWRKYRRVTTRSGTHLCIVCAAVAEAAQTIGMELDMFEKSELETRDKLSG